MEDDIFDESNHGLKRNDPHFPAYLRLFKWKIIDICVEQTSDQAFLMFQELFEREEFENLVLHIRNTEQILAAEKPEMNIQQLDTANLNSKDLPYLQKKRKEYIQYLFEQEVLITRRRYIEYFFQKTLFCDKGIQAADRLLFKYEKDVYNYVHWENCPDDWLAKHTFFEKFYYPIKDENSWSGIQLLDRVARAARGNLILMQFSNNQQYEIEKEGVEILLNAEKLKIHTSLVAEVINESPERQFWNEHKTLLLIASLSFINSNILKIEGKHEDWYYNLLEVMRRDPHNRAALWFLNKDYEQVLEEKEKERTRLRMLKLNGQNLENNEVAAGDEELKELRPQPEKDEEYEEDFDYLELRGYQEELVLPALRGNNVVIVAPTGSGKTEVAIYAALKHIEKRAEKKLASRVIMLVPKIPLVGQQSERFLKYCRGRYHVEGIHGAENNNNGKGRKDDVLKSHIIIMTPQILINMWRSVRESERLYISDFSMVIFDEVHKTTGQHPYQEIANMINDYNGPKPQIIGLTASLNVKATTDQTRMLSEIYKLLATLNATVLSAVHTAQSLAELNKNVSQPDDSVIICRPPIDQNAIIRMHIKHFHKYLHEKLIREIERLSKIRSANVFPQNFLKNAKRIDKIPGGLEDILAYEQWLQQVAQSLNRINSSEKRIAQINTKYLKVIIEARGIVEVMPAYVAFDFLSKEIDILNSEFKLSQFYDFFNANRKVLNNRKHNKEDNADPEIVKYLKDTIQKHFDNYPDSKAIIFVTQRTTAERVSDFLNKDATLKMENGKDAFGYVLGTNNQGSVKQTLQQQQAVIDKFNTGKLKVIVATSVIEEGLDVAACNLIIKYNCSSGSAVQLTQQRGRARAKNSRSVLLVVTNKVNENENNALIAQKYIRSCVQTIMNQSQNHLISQIEIEKEKLKRARQQEENDRIQRANEFKMKSKLYLVKCAKCNQLFCKSDEIKKNYSSFIILHPNIWDKFKLEERRKPLKINRSEETLPLATLLCAQCSTPAGKVYKQCGVYVPQVDVKVLAFTEEYSEYPELITKSKWASVENELFYIGEAKSSNFKAMLNALNFSEANLEKKRRLDCELLEMTNMMIEIDRRDAFARKREEKLRLDRTNVAKTKWEGDEEEEEEAEEKEDSEYEESEYDD